MNQGKLEVVKQEVARVNMDILAISELKCTGMDGGLNTVDHYIYYCGQESLRRNGVAIMVNKRVRNAVFGCNLKNNRMISVRSGHHQMVNTEIRLIIFFAAKDGEALYSQQKQDQELTVAQIINSLTPYCQIQT